MLKIILMTFLALCLTFQEVYSWKHDRRPQIMGDKLPISFLGPVKKSVQKKIVVYHNYFRSNVKPSASNMLRMQWHTGAARSAQKWADECKFLIHNNATERHIDNYGTCGQNIFVSSHQVPWFFAVKTWFLEKNNFTYGSPTKNNLLLVGHYTQLVWASTHEIGCGFTKCSPPGKPGFKTPKTFYNYVCNYCPIGNKPQQLGRPYRRGKRCGACRDSCHMKKLCTNSCPVADLWANCRALKKVWPQWLCGTNTKKGMERSGSCRATCECKNKIHG